MADLSCSIGDVSFKFCAMNAPRQGSISFDELSKLGKSKSGAIVTASMTLEPQEPNPEPNYYEFALGSVSSAGFPNLGYKKYGEMIPRLKQLGKPVIATVTGYNPEEYTEIVSYISGKGPDIIQLDFSYRISPTLYYALVPLVVGNRWDLMERILKDVRKLARQPLGVIQTLYMDPPNVEVFGKIYEKAGVDFLVVGPPVNVGLVIDAEKERSVVSLGSGPARMAGTLVKPVALANVKLYYELLGNRIPIIGAGGVNTGTDIFEYLLAGATAVQVGTAFSREGTEIFSRLAAELSGIMEKKGFNTAREIIGRLKTE